MLTYLEHKTRFNKDIPDVSFNEKTKIIYEEYYDLRTVRFH